jgi:hypothetical protein
MPALTLDDLADVPLAVESVPVPEWGEGKEAWLTALSADELDSRLEMTWLAFKRDNDKNTNDHYRAWVVAACWVTGPERTFLATPAQVEAVAARLGKMHGRPVTRMFDKAAQLNGLIEEDAKKN